jgi:hypothetical protein
VQESPAGDDSVSQIPDLRDRRLRAFTVGRIKVGLIRDHRDELLRLAASIRTGVVSAADAAPPWRLSAPEQPRPRVAGGRPHRPQAFHRRSA